LYFLLLKYKNVKKNKRILASTEELESLNLRIFAAQENIFQLSTGIIFKTVNFIQSHIGCLYYLSSAISYLDMILAFVGYILATPAICIFLNLL